MISFIFAQCLSMLSRQTPYHSEKCLIFKLDLVIQNISLPSTEFDLKMANKWPKKSAFRFSFCNIAGNQTLGSLLCQ